MTASCLHSSHHRAQIMAPDLFWSPGRGRCITVSGILPRAKWVLLGPYLEAPLVAGVCVPLIHDARRGHWALTLPLVQHSKPSSRDEKRSKTKKAAQTSHVFISA